MQFFFVPLGNSGTVLWNFSASSLIKRNSQSLVIRNNIRRRLIIDIYIYIYIYINSFISNQNDSDSISS
jgi:hypothetical protein